MTIRDRHPGPWCPGCKLPETDCICVGPSGYRASEIRAIAPPAERTIEDRIARLRERAKLVADRRTEAVLLGILDLLGDEL